MRPRREKHKKEPLIIKTIVKTLVEFGAIASGIDYLIKIIKWFGRF